MESGVIGAGHRFAATRLDAQRSTAGWVKEQMGGISYLFFIRKLVQRVDAEWDSVKVNDTRQRQGLPFIDEPLQPFACMLSEVGNFTRLNSDFQLFDGR